MEPPDRVIEGLRRAILETPGDRAPRRELAKVLWKTGKWQSLVEALRDEEAQACATAEDKVAVLMEMASVYRDHVQSEGMFARTLERVLERAPSNQAVLAELAELHESQKRWPALMQVLRRWIEVTPEPDKKLELHLRHARLQRDRLSALAEAVKSYEAALELSPGCEEAEQALKEAYVQRREWDKLRELEMQRISRIEDPAARLAERVQLAHWVIERLRRPSAAVEVWEAVLVEAPLHVEALTALAKLYERDLAWDKLAEITGRMTALEEDPFKRAGLFQRIALLWTEKLAERPEAPEQTLAAWQEVYALDPKHLRAQDALKKLLLARGDFGGLDRLYEGLGKQEEFLRVLERQVETSTGDAQLEVCQRIADVSARLGKPDRARRAFERVLSIDKHNLAAAEGLIPLYDTHSDAKHLAEVLAVQLEHTTDLRERRAQLARLARLREDLRDRQGALALWLERVTLAPDDATGRAEAERVASEIREWGQLVEAYRRATPSAALLATVAYAEECELGDAEAAARTYQRVLDLDPDHEDAFAALERLHRTAGRDAELTALLDARLPRAKNDGERCAILVKLGELRDRAGDAAAAVTAFQGVLRASPPPKVEAAALEALARILAREERWEELSAVLTRCLALPGARRVTVL